MIEKLKDFLNKILEDHPDSAALWDAWARRFIMGIDKTKDAAVRAQKANAVRFTEKSGLPDVEAFESESITENTSKHMPFVVKNHAVKAAIAWAASIGQTGTTKEASESEAEMHLISAENFLDFC